MKPVNIILQTFFININPNLIFGLIGFCILILLSGIISGAEVALFSLSKIDIDNVKKNDPNSFKIINKLVQKPKKLLATILIANNFINVGIVILFAFIGEFLFVKIEQQWLKFTVEVILATFLILLFGEIFFKIFK